MPLWTAKFNYRDADSEMHIDHQRRAPDAEVRTLASRRTALQKRWVFMARIASLDRGGRNTEASDSKVAGYMS